MGCLKTDYMFPDSLKETNMKEWTLNNTDAKVQEHLTSKYSSIFFKKSDF